MGKSDVTVDQVNAVVRKATKGKDVREEMLQFMRDKVNWEEHLIPAPYTAAILGNLIRLSMGTIDFELKNISDKSSIKSPKSFRATLAQLSNECFSAFSSAHIGMDKININMKMVPFEFRDVLKTLYFGSSKTMNEDISIPLGEITTASNDSRFVAEQIEEKFEKLEDLCQDILLAGTAERKGVEDRERVQEVKRRNAERKSKNLKRRKEEEQKLVDEYNQKIDEADKRLQEKLDDFPSGWNMFGQDLLGGAMDFVGMGNAADLTNIADGTKTTERQIQNIVDEVIDDVTGIGFMRENLKNLVEKEEEGKSLIEQIMGIVEDAKIKLDPKVLDVLVPTLKDHLENILKDARKVVVDEIGEEKDEEEDEGDFFRISWFANQWKIQTIIMCENALELVGTLDSMKQHGRTTSELSSEEHMKLVEEIITFKREVQNLVEGKINSEKSEYTIKASKENGIMEMFSDVLNVQPIASMLLQMIQYNKKEDREFLQPLPDHTRHLESLRKNLQQLKKTADEVVTDKTVAVNWKKNCQELVSNGLVLIEDVQEIPSTSDAHRQAELIKMTRNFVYKIGKMVTIARKQTCMPSISQKTPKQGKKMKGTENLSYGKRALEVAKQQALEAQANIRQHEKDARKANKRMMELSDRLDDTINQLVAAKAEEADLEDILKIIKTAIKIFSDLKAQWSKIIEFFQLISVLIQASQSACQKFTSTIDIHKDNPQSTLLQGLTFTSAYEAVKITYLIQNMSMWYVNVSGKHIIPRIASLDNIYAYNLNDSAQTKKLDGFMRELNSNVKTAQNDIKLMMKRDQLQFLNNVNRRMNQIRGYFEDLLPDVPSDAAKIALEEHEKDVNDQFAYDGDWEEDVEDYGDDYPINVADIF